MAVDEESSQTGRGSADLDAGSPIGEWAGDDNGKGGQENTGTKEEVTEGGRRGEKQKHALCSLLWFPTSTGKIWMI